jgi:hypothetical protein
MAQRNTNDSRPIKTPQSGSPSTTFKPVQDSISRIDLVVSNPAPNASVPAVPTCLVVNS